jgi:hypothetical protein
MTEVRDDVNDPRELLGQFPAKCSPIMREQITELFAEELPRLLDGTLE